jgi:hypothetical protein
MIRPGEVFAVVEADVPLLVPLLILGLDDGRALKATPQIFEPYCCNRFKRHTRGR